MTYIFMWFLLYVLYYTSFHGNLCYCFKLSMFFSFYLIALLNVIFIFYVRYYAIGFC